MSHNRCKNLHNRAKIMPNASVIADEMQSIVRKAAEPWMPGDSVKSALDRVSRRTGLQYRRIRTFWYRQTEAVSAVEADTLREWHRTWLANRKARLAAEIEQLEREWSDE